MKLSAALLLASGTAAAVSAFQFPFSARSTATKLEVSSLAAPLDTRPIFDPMGLYPKDAEERKDGRIQPLESANPSAAKPVIDPLNLYTTNDAIADVTSGDMSTALPFVTRPAYLDGSMAGDAGFDPLGLAANPDRLKFMREAELKHSRIAMLAAVGWPAAELVHNNMAHSLGLKSMLQAGERVPSILNGGLAHTMADYWPYMTAALVAGGAIEAFAATGALESAPLDESKRSLELSEIKHGRIAMFAIAAMASQEAFTGVGVVSNLMNALHPATFSPEELTSFSATLLAL